MLTGSWLEIPALLALSIVSGFIMLATPRLRRSQLLRAAFVFATPVAAFEVLYLLIIYAVFLTTM